MAESNYIDAYYDVENVADLVRRGHHRGVVGGLWDEIGQLQFDYLLGQGLAPETRLLDIGCGCLRGGVHLVRYLNPGNYFGIDVSQELLDAGYDVELAAAKLQSRLPRENLNANGTFDAGMFGVQFDVAIAQSVFTHLSYNQLKLCMARTARCVRPGGKFYLTIFLADEGEDWTGPIRHSPGGISTRPDANPFHYQHSDLMHAVAGLPWSLVEVVEWGHPRGQRMAVFQRLRTDEDAETAERSKRSDDVRSLDRQAAKALPIGAQHYATYVGPSEQWDLMGATQFRLLTSLGLRENHNLLDIGCGSLRSGRLFLSYLNPGRYFGIEPNKWLIDDVVRAELGEEFIRLRRPRFLYTSDFDARPFGEGFDFIIAQSIFSHAGPDMLRAALASIRDTIRPGGLALATFIDPDDQPRMALEADGWTYPGCITYRPETIRAMVEAAGLYCRKLPWYHPRQIWYAISDSASALPPPEHDHLLSGAVLNVRDFAASVAPRGGHGGQS